MDEFSRSADDTPDTLNPVKAEQALWRAVITQALMDGSSKSKKMESKYEKSQALCWLTGFGEDFKTVCDLADLCPDYVRNNSIEALKRDCKWRADSGFKDKNTQTHRKPAAETTVDQKLSKLFKAPPSPCSSYPPSYKTKDHLKAKREALVPKAAWLPNSKSSSDTADRLPTEA